MKIRIVPYFCCPSMETELLLYGLFSVTDIISVQIYTGRTQFTKSTFENLTVYSRLHPGSKRNVLLISGGCRLEFHPYMQKFVDDMDFPCNVYICENMNTYNMLCIPELVAFANTLRRLTVIGFSMGGVIGSHVIAQANRRDSTLVTVDTPYNMPLSALQLYDNFRLYRIDIIGLYWPAVLFSGSTCLKDWMTTTNIRGYAAFIERTYGISYADFLRLNTMNPNLNNCRVISFYSSRDPLVYRPAHLDILDGFRKKLPTSSTFEEHEFAVSRPAHCSVMVNDRNSGIICKQIKDVVF